MNDIVGGYNAAAAGLIGPYEALKPADVYAPVIDLFPERPRHVIDIGAGTGRDAAWLAGRGADVLAVEPCAAFREAGALLHPDRRITWLDDRLPQLGRIDGAFDLVLLCGVWQHMDAPEREMAMRRLAQLAALDAVVLLSLRHGPSPAGRSAFPVDADETGVAAAACGLALLRRVATQSMQPGNRAMGVRWTWLVLRKAR